MRSRAGFVGAFGGVHIRTHVNRSACNIRLEPAMTIGGVRHADVLRVEDYLRYFLRSVPDLEAPSLYKGATGRVAVIGGSLEYTGAPYFAADASLRGGGELAFVFCAEQAALAIKSYSPELIVYPDFGDLRGEDASSTLSRMHAVLIGPGLGRGPVAEALVKTVIAAAVHDEASWPLVLDGDALYFIAQSSELREMLRKPLPSWSSPRIYLTPNGIELRRLCEAVGVTSVSHLAAWFKNETNGDETTGEGRHEPEDETRDEDGLKDGASGRVIVISKGAVDHIATFQSNGAAKIDIKTRGGQKRCGGQGDVLAGLTTLFAGWSASYIRKDQVSDQTSADNLQTAAAVAACVTTRLCSERAFGEQGRAMVASDLLAHIGPVFDVVASHRGHVSD